MLCYQGSMADVQHSFPPPTQSSTQSKHCSLGLFLFKVREGRGSTDQCRYKSEQNKLNDGIIKPREVQMSFRGDADSWIICENRW